MLSSSSKSSSRGLSASAVQSSSNASMKSKDACHHLGAKIEATKSNLPTHVVQVMRKIKMAKLHPDAEDNELRILAEELTDKEKLYVHFSHIIEDDQEAVVEEGTKFKFVRDMNSEEAANAKEREQMRYDKLASLTLTVCLQDLGHGGKIAGKAVVALANFLSMKYGSKHAAILVNDVILEWGQDSLVVPRRVREDEEFLFKGGIKKWGKYFNQLAEARPKSEEAPKAFDKEIQILSHPVEIKRRIIDNIIDVIVQFNLMFYYHPAMRNCQHFVQKIIVGVTSIEDVKFSPECEAFLEDLRKGKLPTFQCHEDIDAYVMRKGVGSFTKDELGCLIRVYDMHHGGEDCEEITCKHKELLQRLVE